MPATARPRLREQISISNFHLLLRVLNHFARAVGQRSLSATLAWGLACVFAAWTAVFALYRSIHLALAVLAVITLVALMENSPRSAVTSRS